MEASGDGVWAYCGRVRVHACVWVRWMLVKKKEFLVNISKKVLFQFQIAHIQDTLNTEMTTLSLIFMDPVAYLLNVFHLNG